MTLTVAEEDAGKRCRECVNYRRAEDEARSCGTCRYSYGPVGERRCRIVKGFINPGDTCDFWELRKRP
jgi:hypothetical protein